MGVFEAACGQYPLPPGLSEALLTPSERCARLPPAQRTNSVHHPPPAQASRHFRSCRSMPNPPPRHLPGGQLPQPVQGTDTKAYADRQIGMATQALNGRAHLFSGGRTGTGHARHRNVIHKARAAGQYGRQAHVVRGWRGQADLSGNGLDFIPA